VSAVLDFLSPSLAADERGFHPVARSAVESLYRAAGAVFDERDGWQVAAGVPDQSDALRAVGIADLSHLGKLDVCPAPAEAQAESDEGVQHRVVYRLSPRRALVLFPESARADVEGELADARLLLDVTAAYTVLAIAGPQGRELIARLTHLHDFPSGGDVAHVTAHVLPAGDGFRIVVAQELGLYLAEVALDCARALGGGLVGVDVLPQGERA
jgi:glycine cleavage system aminomethyltransferase T